MREKKEINVQIGERIKFARESLKITQEQLAEKVDVSPQYISDLERGVVGISIATLKRVCIVLCVSSDQILFGKEVDSNIIAITERCRGLNNNQIMILSEIINKFVAAIELEHKN